jgi:hypothetical protein
LAQLRREQELLVQLGAALEEGGGGGGAAHGPSAEAMAACASRVARLVSGLQALQQLA